MTGTEQLALETLLTHGAPLVGTWLLVAGFLLVGTYIYRRLP